MNNNGVIKINPGMMAAMSKGGLNLDVFRREITVLECLISGTSFCDLNEIGPRLEAGCALGAKREPKNEFDPFAVSLWAGKMKVGYIPREKNEVIARLMDAGKQFIV